jgi:hypothetical protein
LIVDARASASSRAAPKKRVFFLFSGDFLYEFVFKRITPSQWPPMDKLSQLTKGYYSEDADIVAFFDSAFETFWRTMATHQLPADEPGFSNSVPSTTAEAQKALDHRRREDKGAATTEK